MRRPRQHWCLDINADFRTNLALRVSRPILFREPHLGQRLALSSALRALQMCLTAMAKPAPKARMAVSRLAINQIYENVMRMTSVRAFPALSFAGSIHH